MLYIGLRDYSHFKELFAKRITNNGKSIRQNGILLSYYKNAIKHHELFKEAKDVTNMASLYSEVMKRIRKESILTAPNRLCNCYLGGFGMFYSSEYRTDKMDGFCEDGDITSIRYERISDGRVYKMKAGKFFKKIILETEYGKNMDESTLLHVLEVFSHKWQSLAMETIGDFDLVVDDDFEAIYKSSNYVDDADFHSCMSDCDQHYFYEEAVKAKAASIWRDNQMYARCVIFTEVTDESTGQTLRLAERQYSAEESELYKNILVNKLIKEGHIDGYKKIGAGCHDSRLFVSNTGEDLSDRDFSIRCYLSYGDTLSYQDSFKFFNYEVNKAYNSDSHDYTHDLADTSSVFEGGEWDSYHEEYCAEVRTVYVWNDRRGYFDEETCDVERLDDFYYCECEDKYYDMVEYCSYYNHYIPFDRAHYSEHEEDYFYEDDVVRSKYEEDYIRASKAIWDDIANDYFSNEESLQNWRDENLTQEQEQEQEIAAVA